MDVDRNRREEEARQDESQREEPRRGELSQREPETTGAATPDEGYQAYPGVNLLDERDRQRRRLGRELRETEGEIESSEGFRLYNRMKLLEKSYFVFDTNYLNLRHVLSEFEQPAVFMKLWEEKTRDRFDLFINDVIRLFHNYLAGATTLLDHVHTLRDGLGDQGSRGGPSSFSGEYRERWEGQLGNASLPRFMEDLLVYMLHRGLPFSLAELNFGRIGAGVEVNSAIRLDTNRLTGWEHWSQKGREYLNSLGDREGKVGLDEVVEEYARVVSDFYHWFVLRQSELHRDELDDLERMETRRRSLGQKMHRLEDFLETAERTVADMREERERLARELEEERRRSQEEKTRADDLEAQLEQERARGFFRRRSGR